MLISLLASFARPRYSSSRRRLAGSATPTRLRAGPQDRRTDSAHVDDDLRSRLPAADVANGLARLAQRVLPIDERTHFPSLDQSLEHEQVLLRHRGEERHEPLGPKARSSKPKKRTREDEEHAALLRGAGQHDPSARRERTPHSPEGPGCGEVEDLVVALCGPGEVLLRLLYDLVAGRPSELLRVP